MNQKEKNHIYTMPGRMTEVTVGIEQVWSAVGNIVPQHTYGHGGLETKLGTKQFRPGARVYIVNAFWGMCESVTVIGLPRKSKKYIEICIDAKRIENFRVKLIYKPQVVKAILNYYEGEPDKKYMERICKEVPQW